MNDKEFDVIAEYYDLLFGDRTVDLDFWVKLAKRFGSPVLEFSCGTGRITLPIARAGIEIVGIDISLKMLDKAREKIANETKEIQNNVSLLKADVSSFEIPGRKFKAVFSPWGFPPVTKQEQQNCLISVRNHLIPKGYFVIDINNWKEPTQDWIYYDVEQLKRFPDRGFTLVRQAYKTGSAKTKIGHVIFFLDKVEDDGNIKRFISERDQRVYTRKDVEQLLQENNFEVIETYGNYQFEQYSDKSERMLFVAQMKG